MATVTADEPTLQQRDAENFKRLQLQDEQQAERNGLASNRQIDGDHYLGFTIDPAKFAIQNDIGAYEWDAIKYLLRHERKGGASDLRKAIHDIELILQHKYGESA